MSNLHPVVSTRQAATILGVQARSIVRMVHRGTLVPLGKADGLRGGYVFDRATIEHLRDERGSTAYATPRRSS